VPIGEPGSVSTFTSALPPFEPTGFPTCTADLELRVLVCNGLVPKKVYIARGHRTRGFGIADATGTVAIPMPVRRGDSVRLSNGSRTLTKLRVAKLRVKILGEEVSLAGGRCQPGDYFGPPLSKVPTSAGAGLPSPLTTDGVALTGQICPMSGHARGLSATNIVQTDELSGGQTETEVPDILDTTPVEGETMYGPFTAVAQSGLALADNRVLRTDRITRISLRIVTRRGGKVVSFRNVDRKRGVAVRGLAPGSYEAVWKLTDVNGDIRVVVTRFIEAKATSSPERVRLTRT
jgi:hypothetical protein